MFVFPVEGYNDCIVWIFVVWTELKKIMKVRFVACHVFFVFVFLKIAKTVRQCLVHPSSDLYSSHLIMCLTLLIVKYIYIYMY